MATRIESASIHGDDLPSCLHPWRPSGGAPDAERRRCAPTTVSAVRPRPCPESARDRARSPHRPRPRHQCAVHTVMLAVSTDTVSTSRGAPSWYSDASLTTNGLALGPHASNLALSRDLPSTLPPHPV